MGFGVHVLGTMPGRSFHYSGLIPRSLLLSQDPRARVVAEVMHKGPCHSIEAFLVKGLRSCLREDVGCRTG